MFPLPSTVCVRVVGGQMGIVKKSQSQFQRVNMDQFPSGKAGIWELVALVVLIA